MEPKVIILILERAKGYTLIKQQYMGLCHIIRYAYKDITGYDFNKRYNISRIIPEFTYDNASVITETVVPNDFTAFGLIPAYWWEHDDIKSRIEFLDWLIENYKNKL